jgi:ATP-dependent Clp protease ATP-binding subunit ClpA
MGVSKQAAQKRFVARDEDPSLDNLVPGGRAKLFSRFTRRARDAVAAAARSAQAAGSPEVQPAHLFAGSISDPAAIATKAVRRLGVSDQQVYEALGVSAPAGEGAGDADPSALRQHPFSEPAKESLRSALKSALRLGHNYIGTEHILLGVLSSDPDTAAHLATVGISPQLAEKALAVEMAQFMLENEQRTAG